ncbi:MAG: TetR family transcriptional regulator [Chitinophagales bacterium]|nr:TetR family transcriptional regulator [Hyphomicrobiales bacterium]
MTEPSQTRNAIVEAAMRMAARQGWRDTDLVEIAIEAGVGLDVLRRHFQSKTQILAAFTRMIDDAVLGSLRAEDRAMNSRDRLFDVIMTRFEKMQPYKSGIERIAADQRFSLSTAVAQFGPALASQYWMLAAAGASTEGARGALTVKGMTALYARVFNVWIADFDPGMARTMAELDRGLRRGEDFMRRVDRISKVGDGIVNAMRGARRRHSPTASASEPAQPVVNDPTAASGFSPAS